ncbi:MAG: HNH endonuclease [Saprospiraceae bacterium]|nr:HNH endonuclease [Saprospiraceae bacterium]
MSRYIPESIRQFVAERANYQCAYCLLPQHIAGFQFEIDHIVSIKHRGSSSPDNLAFSCPICNGNKGSDLGTFVENQLVRFFNPRKDVWSEHFELSHGKILPKTPTGEATAQIFDFNRPEDIAVRRKLEDAQIKQ